jgi:hypothetical protein
VTDADQPGTDGDPGTTDASDDLIQSREDGQLHFIKETEAHTFPVTAPTNATPLEEDETDGVIPHAQLWAMKERRHEQWPHLFGHPERIRAVVGAGDAAIYAIDDGSHHRMIGRLVGSTQDGAVYTLVGRVTKATYDDLAAGSIDGKQAFLAASDTGLSGTTVLPGVSNIFDVDYYQRPEEIPAEYLPPAPVITFTEDLPTADR